MTSSSSSTTTSPSTSPPNSTGSGVVGTWLRSSTSALRAPAEKLSKIIASSSTSTVPPEPAFIPLTDLRRSGSNVPTTTRQEEDEGAGDEGAGSEVRSGRHHHKHERRHKEAKPPPRGDSDPMFVEETLPDIEGGTPSMDDDSEDGDEGEEGDLRGPSPICCTPAWWQMPGGDMNHPRWRRVFFRWRTLIILLVIAAFGTILYLFFKPNSPIRSQLFTFFAYLEKDVPVFWGAVIFAEVYAVAEALFLPGTPFDLAAGFAFGPIAGALSAWIGATLGSVVAFWFGRTLLRKWASDQLRRSPKLKMLDRAIGENSFKLVLLTRLSPVLPNPLLSYVYGVTRVRFLPYVVASFLGFGPMTILYCYFGSVLRDVSEIFDPSGKNAEQQRNEKIITLVVSVVSTILIMIVITIITRRALAKAMEGQQAQSEVAPPPPPRRRRADSGSLSGLSDINPDDIVDSDEDEESFRERTFATLRTVAARSSNSSSDSLLTTSTPARLSRGSIGYDFVTDQQREEDEDVEEQEEESEGSQRGSWLKSIWHRWTRPGLTQHRALPDLEI